MSPPATPKKKPKKTPGKKVPVAAAAKRRYNSPLRQQQTAQTRERIIAAGSELVHGFSSWDWRGLTFRAVGEGAGVTERTVHRHFANERELRDAVVQRLIEESGVALERVEVSLFGEITAGLFAYLASFPVAPVAVDDPSFASIDRDRREALLGAVVRATPSWTDAERMMAASMFDMLWNVPSYERLVTAWRLDPEQATGAVTWVIGLIEEAIRQGRRPGTA
jgi:AcrR family transcriptional regulator